MTESGLQRATAHQETQLGGLARRLAYDMNKEFGVRLLSGESLTVPATHKVMQ